MTMSSTSSTVPQFQTLKLTRPREYVVQVELNRPEKRNAMNITFWKEMVDCFHYLNEDPDCRAIVVSGAGKMFTAGLDMEDGVLNQMQEDEDIARKAFKINRALKAYQESFTIIEKCTKPVIAAIHNACIGGGIDLTSACDIRYCSLNAWFQIKEIDIGLAADVGTLQRFPKIVGNDSLVRELAYTGRKFFADEAKNMGYVSRVFPDKQAMTEGAIETAALIASKSPVAVQVSKVAMVYARDHSVAEGLDHIASWNQGMLQSEDLRNAIMAQMQKKAAVFSKL